jgi:ubiquitin fusion degradation protein 1
VFFFASPMFSRRGFADSFRVHSVSLLAAETHRDPTRLEYSDKIILPPSCLEKLAHLEVQYPLMFELTNPRYVQRRLHCGVLEFIAQEGMVYLPYWMMENMHLNEGDIVHLKSASLQKGRFVKLQPQTTDFIKVSNPKAVLEQSLRHFSALTKGETFRILYNKKKYDIGVVEVRPEGAPFAPGAPEAVCIIEADVEVDFDAPADYVEPPRVSPQSASPLSTSPLTKSPLLGPALGAPVLDGNSSDEEMADAKPFTGSGFRLDGKPIKAPKANANSSLLHGNSGAVSVGINLGAGQTLGGGRTLGGGAGQTLGGGAGQTLGGGGQTLGGGASAGLGSGSSFGPPPDGFRRLGLAAKEAPKGEDYWASLSGGNKLR